MTRATPRSQCAIPLTGMGAALVLLSLPTAGAAPETRRDWAGADAPYLKVLHKSIHPRWSAFLTELGRLDASYQDPTLAVELVISIDAGGALKRVDYTRHARVKGFDDAPGDLLRDLGTLPAPPLALQSDDGHVYVRWRFERRLPGCEVHSIIERRLPLREAVPRLVHAGRAAEAASRLREERPSEERTVLLRSFVEALGRYAATAKARSERELAAPILAQLPDAEPSLLALLGDPEPAVRLRALESLSGRQLSPAMVAPLRRLLGGEDRAIAALLLSRLGDREAVAALREALATGQRAAETTAALRSLGDGAEASRIVARLLERPETRLAGVQAASALGDPHLAPALLKSYGGGNEELRLAILDAVGAMGARAPSEARKIVIRAMSDLSAKVRARAMQTSAHFGDHSVGLRYRLIDSLPDPDEQVRAAAAAALVQVGGEDAKDELLRVTRDRSVAVRATVLQAALAYPYPSSGTLISRLRRDPEVEKAARLQPPQERPGRRPLLTSRVPLPGNHREEDERLTKRLLEAADSLERLRAAADWLALERPSS